MKKLIEKIPPGRLFLIDAAGAFVSVVLLTLVLPALESYVGMPYRVLYILAAFAVILFLISAGLLFHRNGVRFL